MSCHMTCHMSDVEHFYLSSVRILITTLSCINRLDTHKCFGAVPSNSRLSVVQLYIHGTRGLIYKNEDILRARLTSQDSEPMSLRFGINKAESWL